MRANITVDTRGFQGLVNDLLRLSNNPKATFGAVLKSETGKVLESCVKFTGSAKAKAKPRKQIPHTDNAKIWVNNNGNVWLSEKGEGKGGYKHYIMKGPGRWPASGDEKRSRFSASGAHWNDSRWALGQQLLAQWDTRNQTKTKLNKRTVTGRGLAKQSWVQVANNLGIDLKVPSYVTKAIPQDGVRRVAGIGREFASARSIFFEIENRYPILNGSLRKMVPGMDGSAILQRAVKSRLKNFENELKHDLFKNLSLAAKRHPGVFVA